MQPNASIDSLEKYRLLASLGPSGIAKLYVAAMNGDDGSPRLALLKVFDEDLLTGFEQPTQAIFAEARRATELVHRNIVRTYEVGEADGRCFFALEYVEGQSLRALSLRAARAGLPLADELRIVIEVARGLHYAHELRGPDGAPLGIVHRDVCPQNVVVTYDGQVKISDFGMARLLEAQLTQLGIVKGKLDYIAPEQLRGDAVDRRADVFALGAMLWEAVTGQRFAGGRAVSTVAKIHARLHGREEQVRTVVAALPESLANIVDRAIALEPYERFQTAAELADALEGYLVRLGESPSEASLASTMTTLFSAERHRVRSALREQLSAPRGRPLRLSDSTGEFPALGPNGPRSSSGIWLGPAELSFDRPSLPPPARMSLPPPPPVPVVPALPVEEPVRSTRSVATRVAVVVVGTALGAAVAHHVPRQEEIDPAPIAARSPVASIAPPTARAAEPPTVRTASPVQPAPDNVRVALQVDPPSATITIDGATVTAPFRGLFRREEVLHYIEVRAPGYRPARYLVAFDQDRTVDVVLRRIGAAPSGETGSVAPDAALSAPALPEGGARASTPALTARPDATSLRAGVTEVPAGAVPSERNPYLSQ